jgi:hypothetical protein
MSAGPGRVEPESAAAEAEAPARTADWRIDVAAVLRGGAMEVGTARALQRTIGNRRFGRVLARQTPGDVTFASARSWLDQDAKVKVETDVLRAAIREIKRGKSVGFNRDAGKLRLATALTELGKGGEQTAVEAEWIWLVENRAKAAEAEYQRKEREFFAHFVTPLATESAARPRSRATYWLRNSPAKVLDDVISAANEAGLPPAELYAYAMVEGLDDWVRDEIGFPKGEGREPTLAELASVNTARPVIGFAHLGIDDFWLDLASTRKPLSGFLPSGFDTSLVTHEAAENEEEPPRLVDSAGFPTLKMGLQALAASIKRRRAIFLDDASRLGYDPPTQDELVYWTYIYSNVGENVSQLEKYKGKRKLSDWITRREYPNAIETLESFRMIEKMAVF